MALGPDEPSRMILRGVLRRPVRSGLTVLGLGAAVALYISSASSTDNVERMIDLAFDRADRSDLTVTFTEARDSGALHDLRRLPGVLRAEPFRATGARLISAHRMVREGIVGSSPDADLNRLVDGRGEVIEPRPAGFILPGRLAHRLGVSPGDRITADITEGERRRIELPVAAVIDSPLGSSARLDQSTLNHVLREGPTISGAYLAIDGAAKPALLRRLTDMPLVASVTSKQAVVLGIRDTVAQAMGIVTLFNSGLAILIVFGVVYNSARISLSERARDLASMRVLGFHRSEAAFILLGELGILVVAALGPGVVLGIALSRYVAGQFSNDLYTIPTGFNPTTAADGVLIIMVAAAATALLIRIRVDRLDLVRALKTRE
jgi:putative ABC transport system permease protein